VPGAAGGAAARIQESEGRQLRIAGQNDFLGFIRCVPDTESSGSCFKASANDFILLEFRSRDKCLLPLRCDLGGLRRSFRHGAKRRRWTVTLSKRFNPRQFRIQILLLRPGPALDCVAHAPFRPHAYSPFRRFAHSPFRPFADTPIRRHSHNLLAPGF
jgi:hypothetical protein